MAAPAVKNGSGSIWKKELRARGVPERRGEVAKYPDRPRPDDGGGCSHGVEVEEGAPDAVCRSGPQARAGPALESAESALLSTCSAPRARRCTTSGRLRSRRLRCCSRATISFLTRFGGSRTNRGARRPSELLLEIDPVATSDLDEPVRDDGGYEFGPPATSSEEVGSVDLVEGDNDLTRWARTPPTPTSQTVRRRQRPVARRRPARCDACPYGGGDARDRTNRTLRWRGPVDLIDRACRIRGRRVAAASELGVSRAGISRRRRARVESQAPPSWGPETEIQG